MKLILFLTCLPAPADNDRGRTRGTIAVKIHSFPARVTPCRGKT